VSTGANVGNLVLNRMALQLLGCLWHNALAPQV
jgi:hypothetical protein